MKQTVGPGLLGKILREGAGGITLPLCLARQWKMISTQLVERQEHLVQTLHHEAVNSRLHVVIQSMPPYSPYTTLNYRMLQATAIHNAISVPAWHPGWRIPCAYPCSQRADQHIWEALSEEWWHYYYELIGFQLPSTRAAMSLMQAHDPLSRFSKNDYEHCLPMNCDVPDSFQAKMTSFEDVLRTVKEKHESAVFQDEIEPLPAAKKKKKGKGGHRRRLRRA